MKSLSIGKAFGANRPENGAVVYKYPNSPALLPTPACSSIYIYLFKNIRLIGSSIAIITTMWHTTCFVDNDYHYGFSGIVAEKLLLFRHFIMYFSSGKAAKFKKEVYSDSSS